MKKSWIPIPDKSDVEGWNQKKKINHTKNCNYKNESENQNKNKHVLP
jgi:hypothetical protein